MGYVLPWGNMSYWGAQVIVSLFGSLPVIGGTLVEWIRGDYDIADRHLESILRPACGGAAAGAGVLGHRAHHGAARGRLEQSRRHRHQKAQGCRRAVRSDGMPFHPYYTVKDLMGVGRISDDFCGGDLLRTDFRRLVSGVAEFRAGQSLADPAGHRAGLVLHALLRHVARHSLVRRHPGMGRDGDGRLDRLCCSSCPGSIARRCVRSATGVRYTKSCWRCFRVAFVCLAVCGMKPPSGIYPILAQICTAIYFAFFLLMPWYTKFDRVKPVPERVTGHA